MRSASRTGHPAGAPTTGLLSADHWVKENRLLPNGYDASRADARTFESLDRIGSVRAQQIVEERARAPFERVDDLLRVRGIGPRTLEDLRPVLAANPRAPKPGSVDSPQCRAEAVAGKMKGK